jgi:hypothetical protein
MDTPQQPELNTEANNRRATDAIMEVLQMNRDFLRCHAFVANWNA